MVYRDSHWSWIESAWERVCGGCVDVYSGGRGKVYVARGGRSVGGHSGGIGVDSEGCGGEGDCYG